jgi:hypothetical protein
MNFSYEKGEQASDETFDARTEFGESRTKTEPRKETGSTF